MFEGFDRRTHDVAAVDHLGRLAAEVSAVLTLQRRGHLGGFRQGPVHVVLEELLEFRTPFVEPLFLRGDAVAVEHHEWVGQLGPGGKLRDVWQVRLEGGSQKHGEETREEGVQHVCRTPDGGPRINRPRV